MKGSNPVFLNMEEWYNVHCYKNFNYHHGVLLSVTTEANYNEKILSKKTIFEINNSFIAWFIAQQIIHDIFVQ